MYVGTDNGLSKLSNIQLQIIPVPTDWIPILWIAWCLIISEDYGQQGEPAFHWWKNGNSKVTESTAPEEQYIWAIYEDHTGLKYGLELTPHGLYSFDGWKLLKKQAA